MTALEDLTLTRCGNDCSTCPSFRGEDERQCPGCSKQGGTPWWGTCKVYKCVDQRGVENCGLCGDFPCKMIAGYFDRTNPEGQKDAVIRMGILAYCSKHGSKEALSLLRKITG